MNRLLDRQQPEAALARLDAVGSPPAVAGGAAVVWLRLRATALKRLGRLNEARRVLDESLALAPDDTDALEMRGNTSMALGEPARALDDYDRVLALQPQRGDSRFNRGLALLRLRRAAEALQSFEALARDEPGDVQVQVECGNALLDLRRLAEAAAAYERALALEPGHASAWHNLGVARQEGHDPAAAAAAYARALQLEPDFPQLPGKLLHARMQACDWDDLPDRLESVEAALREGTASIDPFALQGITHSEALQLQCARLAAREYEPQAGEAMSSAPPLLPATVRGRPSRLRIGYVAGEFRQHATAMLTVQLFEQHDRGRFQVFGFDNGWDDGSALRRRLVAAFDELVDISSLSDEQATQAIRQRGIDILVDLSGYFGRGRPALFGRRACPIQVTYLGFPGTSGMRHMDYIVADRWVIPSASQAWYSEQVVTLPHCYQANDARRDRPSTAFDRAAAGLPADGFVFCCFNNSYKITPAVFAVWMRLLQQVPGSVLWLLQDNPAAALQLRRRAQAAGVASQRLVFAPRWAPADHLARHVLADLFLDTSPCNAHTTASDALWMGLPLLTCTGSTFSGRVATSLLCTLGLQDELVVDDLAQYEQRALHLARDAQALAGVREALGRRLADPGQPLFDGGRLCRDLETAYERMWAQWSGGGLPQPIDLAASPQERPPVGPTCGSGGR